MRLKKNNSGLFFILMLICFVIGSLGWEVLEKIFQSAGYRLSLTTPPVGIDMDVLKFMIKVNPGSFLGLLLGIYIFKGL